MKFTIFVAIEPNKLTKQQYDCEQLYFISEIQWNICIYSSKKYFYQLAQKQFSKSLREKMLGAAFKFIDSAFDYPSKTEEETQNTDTIRRSITMSRNSNTDATDNSRNHQMSKCYEAQQLEDHQKRILQEFKKYSSNRPKSNQIQNQQNSQPKRQSNRINSKVQLKEILSRIDELSEQYRESFADQGHLKNSLSVMGSTTRTNKKASSGVISGQKGKGEHTQGLDRFSVNNSWIHNSSQIQRQRSSANFLKEVFLSLGLVDKSQSHMHIDIVMEAAKDSFEQMKKSGKWKDLEAQAKSERQSSPSEEGQIKRKNSIKKVRIVSPETVSYLERKKEKLDEQLSEAVFKLTGAIPLTKYCYNKKKTEDVLVSFSSDLAYVICKVDGREPNVFDLKNINGVIAGAKTKNFKKYYKEIQELQSCCFSLILNDRSLDFVVSDSTQRNEIVKSIKMLISSI